MKSYQEIKKAIEEARAAISHDAENQLIAYLDRVPILPRSRRNAEQIEESDRMHTACRKEEDRNLKIAIYIEILKVNYYNSYFYNNVKTVAEVWNKYEGKKIGEKTREKIHAELYKRIGVGVSVSNQYRGSMIKFYTGGDHITGGSGDGVQVLDSENKAIKIDCSAFAPWYCGKYTEDPAGRVRALVNAFEEAEEARAAYEGKANIYNGLRVGEINHIEIPGKNSMLKYIKY